MSKVLLSEFLKEKGCYDEFVECFDRDYAVNGNFKNTPIMAFCNWETTKSKGDFWGKICNRWGDITNKENDMMWLLAKDNLTNIANKDEECSLGVSTEAITKPSTIYKCTYYINEVEYVVEFHGIFDVEEHIKAIIKATLSNDVEISIKAYMEKQ